MVVLPSVTRVSTATTLTAFGTQVLDDSAAMGRCTQKAVHQSVAQVLANERCRCTECRNLHEWIRRAGNVTLRNTCNCGNVKPICLCAIKTHLGIFFASCRHTPKPSGRTANRSILPGTCLGSKAANSDPPPHSRDVLGRLSGLKDTFTDVSPCIVPVATQESIKHARTSTNAISRYTLGRAPQSHALKRNPAFTRCPPMSSI